MNIAIAGFGIEGRESYKYYESQGEHSLTILDERTEVGQIPAGAQTKLGPGAYTELDQFDMVVRTAGLSPKKLHGARRVWSATNEFFARCPAPIIGVTGTKGKGTTSSFIYSMLREAGVQTHLVGNIGTPALQVLPSIAASDVVVYELSSFQLWDIERSPQTAVVLMIEPDHLDVHGDFAEYSAAKANIVRHQRAGDVCFYHPSNEYSRQIASQQPAIALGIATYGDQKTSTSSLVSVYVRDGVFVTTDGRTICRANAVKLPGAHNIENACAALSACLAYVQDTNALARGLAAFTGLEHRLKFVAKKADVAYYDDSIATTPGSAIAALQAFAEPKILIAGGSFKGADFTQLAAVIADSSVRQTILIGDEADRIAKALVAQGVEEFISLPGATMPQIVAASAQSAQSGDVVILSPACASFGMFKNYQDRGQQFIEAVHALNDERQM